MSRIWGEDASRLAEAGADVALLDRLEQELVGQGRLKRLERELLRDADPRGAWDAHVHLGRDADGHRLTPPALLADLDRHRLAGAVCFPANDPGDDRSFRRANDLVLDAAEAAGGRIVPFCRLDPGGPWQGELERAAAAGARGLKLHPVAQRFRPESGPAVAAVRAATARGWPVLLHAGFSARALAAPIAALLAAVPDCRLILAHGGRGDARALAALAREHEGVSFDTSLAALPDLVALPPERLVFGSDRPYGEHATALQLVGLAAEVAGWDAGQVAGVLGGNLARLLDA